MLDTVLYRDLTKPHNLCTNSNNILVVLKGYFNNCLHILPYCVTLIYFFYLKNEIEAVTSWPWLLGFPLGK